LDFYEWVYPFLKFEDLLFYLYPIALEFERTKSLDCIDSFLYSLDRFVPIELSKLSKYTFARRSTDNAANPRFYTGGK